MESHATVTEGGKRRSGGFLGFGRKKDKPKVDEEDVKSQRLSFTVAGRSSGGLGPDLSRPASQPPGTLTHQDGAVIQQQQQQQQRTDFGPTPPTQHACAQSLGANQAMGTEPAASRPEPPAAPRPEPPRNTPPESPASSSPNIDGKDPSFRRSFEPVVELISYQPHKTYVSSPPQLEMIFARTSAGQQPRQGAPGSPTNDWDAVWLQLAGTSLSMWSMKETRAAAAAGTKVPPTYFNITESTLEILSALPPPRHRPYSHSHKHVLSLNTAGSNRLLFSCPTDKDLVRWTTGLRLAAWERSRLEEVYTGHLIQAGRREPPSPLAGGHLEGWVRVRVMGGIEWHRLWLVLSDPAAVVPETSGTQGKRRSSFFGLGHEKHEPIQEPNTGVTMASFYNEPRTAKNRTSSLPVLTVTNVTQTYAMFPERLEVISQSNLMKVVGRVSGELVTIEGGLRESGWAMIMPEAPSDDHSTAGNRLSPLGVMMRWVTAFHDAFKLYGRPERYSWNERDPKSLFFGYPRGEFRADLFLSMEEAVSVNHRLNTPAIRAEFIGLLQSRMSRHLEADQINAVAVEGEDPKIVQERAYVRQAEQESAAMHKAQQQKQQNGKETSFTLPPLQFSDEGVQDAGSGTTSAVAGTAAAGALAAAGAAALFHDDQRVLTPITESDASRQNSARRPTGDSGAGVGTALGSPTPPTRAVAANNTTPHAYQPEVPPGQQAWGQNQSRAPVQKGDALISGTANGIAVANPTGPPVRPASMATFGNRTSSDELPPITVNTPTATSPSREASTLQGTLRSEDSLPTIWSQSSGVTPQPVSPRALTTSHSSSFVSAVSLQGSVNSVPNGITTPVQQNSPAPPPVAKSPTMMPIAAVGRIPEAIKPITPQFIQPQQQNARSVGPGLQTSQPRFANQTPTPPLATNHSSVTEVSLSSHGHSKSSHATIPAVTASTATAAVLGTQAFGIQSSPPRHSPPSDGTLHQPKPSRSQRMSITEVPGLREEPAAMYLMNMVEEPVLPATLQGTKAVTDPAPVPPAVVAPASTNGPSRPSPVRQAPTPAQVPASNAKSFPASPKMAASPPTAAPAPPTPASTGAAGPHASPPPNVTNLSTPPTPTSGPIASSLLASAPQPPQQASPLANTSPNLASTAAYVAGAGAGAVALGAAAAQYSQPPPTNPKGLSPSRSLASAGSDKPSSPVIVTALDQQQYHTRTGVHRKPSGARAQQQPLSAVRRGSAGSGDLVNAIQEKVEGGEVASASSPGTADRRPIDNHVLASPRAHNSLNFATSTTRAPNNVNTSTKMHDLAPDTATFIAYADEPPASHQSRPKLPSPPQPAQETRSSFAPSKQAAERRAKAEAAAAEHQRTMNVPGAGRQKAAQKPDNWDGSDTDESEEEEDEAVPPEEQHGSRALPSLPLPPTIQQPAYQPQQTQFNQYQFNQQQLHQQQQFYGGPGPAHDDRFEVPNMNNLSINDPRFDRPRSRSPPAPHRHLPPQPQQLPQEPEVPRQQQQRAAPLPQPPAAKTNVWNANFEVEHGMDRKGTFVELEEPQVALTKAFTPGGLIQAGMQDKRDRSAKRQEEVARETGSALVNVPEPPPPPQTGLVGAVAAHERDRKNPGGIGATLTDRDRERRLAEDRQRKIEELQRQQMEHMQQQYTGGGMFPGQFSGYGYGMPPMGFNPYGMPMNPAAQQQAMMAAQMAYQQTMVAMSQAGSQAGDAPDGRMSPQSQMRMSPPPFQMGHMGQMPGMGFPYGMPPTQGMYGGFPGYGMPGMGPPSAWGGSQANYPQGLAPGNGNYSPAGGSYPSSERAEERQAS
ncbi:hypothetical protein CspeluHIS016_0110260 [Cutaneotrichosporon spelunceum]|uniref:Skg3/CAF120-like PH-like domain-containing protein n=1 Tax=Cutaneotrichosporon spelunceum TaxID=1672016 RepID=A0AAD3Y8T1_9TREE|nr:hypothetical protein CspeluHIS016_0110260 [Cutaneotrichosporon spelunceum]